MAAALDHVMIVAGDRHDWRSANPELWGDQARDLAQRVAAAGGRWLTLRPYGGDQWEPEDGATASHWTVDGPNGSCTVIVDATPDGRVGFARAVQSIPGRDEIDEKRVAEALYAPADSEPDLIVILGPRDHLPPSLVWELAYGELVYSTQTFGQLSGDDIDLAIAEFATRDRRFGGLSPS